MNAADRKFATEMIPHHEMAIEMARTVLRAGEDPQIRQLAENVIKTQTEEIQKLRQLLGATSNVSAKMNQMIRSKRSMSM